MLQLFNKLDLFNKKKGIDTNNINNFLLDVKSIAIKTFIKNLTNNLKNTEIIYGEIKNDNEIVIVVNKDNLKKVLYSFKNNLNFSCLTAITAVDYPELNKRFELNYLLLSIDSSMRARIKVYLEEDEAIESITSIFSAANWYEREVWDMFGIFFYNHPDLRRILTDYGFEGFPLRKDFPLMGYYEARYDENLKRVVYPKVELAQEYRQFDILNPWIVLNKNFNQNSIVYTN